MSLLGQEGDANQVRLCRVISDPPANDFMLLEWMISDTSVSLQCVDVEGK